MGGSAELLTRDSVEWSRSGSSTHYTITTGWQWGCVYVCRDCREFIVVCECEFVHLSLSLSFLRAVYCLIQWVRNELCRKLGNKSKGLYASGFQLVHSCHVTGCGSWRATGSGTERNGVPASVCTFTVFFFLVAIVSTPSMVYTFTEAATTEAKHREEGREVVTRIHDYGNILYNE